MDEETIRIAHEAETAKSRLVNSYGAVKQRLTPQAIAREAIDKAKTKATDAAQVSVDKVKANPSTAIGIAAAAVLILFRKPIFGAMKRLSKEKPHD